MGRYLGKCKGVMGEVAVVGVRTRARAALAMAATTTTAAATSGPEKKIRKVSGAAATTTTRCSNVHQLRSSTRRRVAVAEKENSAPSSSCRPETTANSSDFVEATANCAGNSDVSADFPASCCSSNIASSSCEVVKDRLEIVADPEVESSQTLSRHIDCRSEARRDQSKLEAAESDNLDTPPRNSNAKSTVQIKMPSDSEIEDFFAAAEKDLQKRFTDKYNFDIVKDVPLEGRYEWLPIKQ